MISNRWSEILLSPSPGYLKCISLFSSSVKSKLGCPSADLGRLCIREGKWVKERRKNRCGSVRPGSHPHTNAMNEENSQYLALAGALGSQEIRKKLKENKNKREGWEKKERSQPPWDPVSSSENSDHSRTYPWSL